MILSRQVWATTRFVGFHSWPDAPNERSYLRARHRHVFHVRAKLVVQHADRAVEFHDLQDEIDAIVARLLETTEPPSGPGPYLRGMSCEHIAESIAESLIDRYGTPAEVDVSEDGENGATVVARP